MMINGFLLGIIATASFTAGIFFLRFWRDTRDSFFLLFAAFFIIEGVNRTAFLLLQRPNEGHYSMYLVRLIGFLLILVAIVNKNYRRKT